MAFLFFLFILAPLTGILLLAWVITKNKWYGQIVINFWLALFGFFVVGTIIRLLTDKKELEKQDYYGEYIVNRNYFPGRQADWQYENFRFEIKDNDSIYFYVTNKEKIIKTYRGTIKTTDPGQHVSERLIINME